MAASLRAAAPGAGAAGVTLLVEALDRWEHPRYLLDGSPPRAGDGRGVYEAKARFRDDPYHLRRVAGGLITPLTRNLPWVGHVQVADVPGPHEPGTRGVPIPNVLRTLEGAGYDGSVNVGYRSSPGWPRSGEPGPEPAGAVTGPAPAPVAGRWR